MTSWLNVRHKNKQETRSEWQKLEQPTVYAVMDRCEKPLQPTEQKIEGRNKNNQQNKGES